MSKHETDTVSGMVYPDSIPVLCVFFNNLTILARDEGQLATSHGLLLVMRKEILITTWSNLLEVQRSSCRFQKIHCKHYVVLCWYPQFSESGQQDKSVVPDHHGPWHVSLLDRHVHSANEPRAQSTRNISFAVVVAQIAPPICFISPSSSSRHSRKVCESECVS